MAEKQPAHIMIHVGEVILKGANRAFFERRLVDSLNEQLAPLGISAQGITRGYGRAIVALPEGADVGAVREALRFIPGIANFAFAVRAENEIESITQKVLSIAALAGKGGEGKTRYSDSSACQTGQTIESFAVNANRADKRFPLSSQNINDQVGAAVQKETGWRVDLKRPDITLFIEITEHGTFLYTKKIAGMGGLPRGTSGHGVALLSGGIDSPVAAYLMLARGMTISIVHFHSLPKTSPESIEKVRALARLLARTQPHITLYLVPLVPIQQEIVKHCPGKLRVVLQRRFMARIAEKIARQEKAQALISGDALGQVASQTIENIAATEDAVDIPLFRPLIGADKQSITDTARRIGTYNTSILPHEDCCTAFMPDKPETKARFTDVHRAEKALDVEGLVSAAIQNAEKETISKA